MIIGIDPGKNGAVVCIKDDKIIKKFVMPNIGNEFDIHEFNILIENIILTHNIIHVFIERVHAIFGSSAKATFIFGKICGIIEGIIVSHKLKYTLIEPKIWQKIMFQGIPEIRKSSKKIKGKLDTKKMAEIAAKRLFPNENFKRTEKSKNNHDGIIDALLIAEYGKRFLLKYN